MDARERYEALVEEMAVATARLDQVQAELEDPTASPDDQERAYAELDTLEATFGRLHAETLRVEGMLERGDAP